MLTRRSLLAGIAACPALGTMPAEAQIAATRVSEEQRRTALGLEGRVDIGPADGDVSVIEFFDYNCSVCRTSSREVAALLAQDRRVRLVLVNVPSLGIPSIEAAKVALAYRDVAGPAAYATFHARVYALRGTVDGMRTLEVATQLGADRARLVEVANGPLLGRMLTANARLADAVGARVTPAYIVGNRFVGGAPGLDGLKLLVSAARRT